MKPLSDRSRPTGPRGCIRGKRCEMNTAINPSCRVCAKTEPVLGFPDDHSQTICPDCCDKATHHDGETGHQWEYQKWERDHECRYCGIPRRCTECAWDD